MENMEVIARFGKTVSQNGREFDMWTLHDNETGKFSGFLARETTKSCLRNGVQKGLSSINRVYYDIYKDNRVCGISAGILERSGVGTISMCGGKDNREFIITPNDDRIYVAFVA